MPSKSEAQKKLMRIACHDEEFAKKNGIDQKVACEFYEADKAADAKKKGKKKKVSTESGIIMKWKNNLGEVNRG